MTRRSVLWLCAIVLASCATPLPPTGGPPDDVPPRIAESTPEPGAVNVSDELIRITFSEYVQESSFMQAFSISPAPEAAPEISWSGRTVEIRLPGGLRANTTYVITLDTALRDIHAVAVTQPITLAFSSGPLINRGTISGRVVEPDSGEPVPTIDVFAYAVPDTSAPDSLPRTPAYRTQTNPSGEFSFTYMTEQLYFVAALRDQNRNLAPDPSEAFAAPPVPALRADTTASAPSMPWVVAEVDTVRPEPQRVESLSPVRHEIRFSEPVRFADRDASMWAVTDSASGSAAAVTGLYTLDEPRVVYFTTEPLGPDTYAVTPAALVDTSGNAVLGRAIHFRPAARDDTLQLRFRGFLPPAPAEMTALPGGIEPGLRFNQPISNEALAAALRTVDSSGTAVGFSAVTSDGATYRLQFEPALGSVGPLEIQVNGAALGRVDSTYTAVFDRIPASETGELSGVVQAPSYPAVVEAYPVESDWDHLPPVYVAEADSTGTFLFAGLPAGTYRLRAFIDMDLDLMWTPGLLVPYVRPEPVTWLSEPQRVRARWETSLPDTLRIPDLTQ